jgi:hypothetical protein
MSFSKRVLFGNDPADDHLRQRLAEITLDQLKDFQFKVPLRKRNRLPLGPYWDPFWRSCVYEVAAELRIEIVNINDQCCTKSQIDAAAIRRRAEVVHKAKVEAFMASNPTR